MARSEAQILAKLDTPPAAQNWALSNFKEQRRTTSALVNLAIGFPQISYFWAHRTIQIVLSDGRTDEEAINILQRFCPPGQWEHNLAFLHAFLEFNRTRCYRGIPVYEEFRGNFMAGPDVKVPVKPTAILREDGVLKPLFVIGWAHNRLAYFQRRLLSTVHEDAIYSLTDLRQSPGEVLILPENGYGIRQPEVWHRDTYELLSREELTEQVTRYVKAREEARIIIPVRLREQAARKAARAAQERTRRERSSDLSQASEPE
jgi:hypothetical protein